MLKEGLNRLLVRLLYGLGVLTNAFTWGTAQPLILINWKEPHTTYSEPIAYGWFFDVITEPERHQVGIGEMLAVYLLLGSILLVFVLGSWGLLVVRARFLPVLSLLSFLMALFALGISLWAFKIDSKFSLNVVGVEFGAGAYLLGLAAALVCLASFVPLRLGGDGRRTSG